jgi:hypothetical protein
MKHWFLSFLFGLVFCLLAVRTAEAITDPLAVPNNRFGIHILESQDLPAAAALVNSNGDWGYITVVLRLNDLNHDHWQQLFDEMRRRHLIPIVRLATVPENSHWVKPKADDADRMTEFLNSLNWVVANRYVILFNEPNQAKEWGNDLKPQEYAVIARSFAEKLKAASADYFILPAALDTAAANTKETMPAAEYWRQMWLADREVFTLFDGWNSHSYPNPGFSGPLSGSGLGTIRSFRAEINFLTRYGLPADLPVFITETGWHNTVPDLPEKYVTAFTQVFNSSRIVAVTPFVLNFPAAPFAQFSWLGTSHYDTVAHLPKTSGQPEQFYDSRIQTADLPDTLVDDSEYEFIVKFTNTGQSIWEPEKVSLSQAESLWQTVEPGQTAEFQLKLKTGIGQPSVKLKLELQHQGQPFGESLEKTIQVVAPPNLIVKAKLLLKQSVTANDFTLAIYETSGELKLKTTLAVNEGQSLGLRLHHLVPGRRYRLVLSKPKYFPRELIKNLDSSLTMAEFGRLWPNPIAYLRLRL